MKILKWLYDNILFVITLFLLAFIPLYPKIPFLDIQNTWVYVRAEDFVIAFTLILWIVLFFRKKVTLKTPLTLPILLFWLVGGLSTLHGVLLLFPTLANTFSNVALLSFLRRIEYLFLFFIAFGGMRDKRFLTYVIATLVIVLLAISGYGFGQKFFGFPAFLTMNEEFAKGVPIQLSQLSRVPSTFAGHYDLAAYLVLIIPILISLVFGIKNLFVKLVLLGTACIGFALLFMTVSRVSFFVLLLSLVILLFLQKKRVAIISLLLLTIVFLIVSPRLLDRFSNTVSETNVLVDTVTGNAIGHVKEVPSKYFDNKLILTTVLIDGETIIGTSSAIYLNKFLPPTVYLLEETNIPTGESLPQGTGYINLALSPVIRKLDRYFFEKNNSDPGTDQSVHMYFGNYAIKRALAYDLSFTTRFQGEWPKTIDAFKKNIFIGAGYGSVSLAVDNNYLRILGETGLAGLIFFMAIFIMAGAYIKKLLPRVESPIVRCFVFGFVAGTFGLMLNAVLIDVFEASKVAFTYWLLMGIVIGTMHLYSNGEVDLFKELKKVLSSTYAVVVYIFVLVIALFSSVYNSYFTGSDFTWFRWISECSKDGMQQCSSLLKTIIDYFVFTDGIIYQPGTKTYFLLMHSVFWLNQTIYHAVSILLHFSVAILLFLIAKRIFNNYLLAVLSGAFFLVLSGNSEAIYWISSTDFLFNAVFALLGLLSFIYWKETKNIVYFMLSIVSVVLSLLFHELGIISPFLIILYDTILVNKLSVNKFSAERYHLLLLSPLIPYSIVRYQALVSWLGNVISNNLLLFPLNFIANIVGYLGLELLGPSFFSMYLNVIKILEGYLLLEIPVMLLIIVLIAFGVWAVLRRLEVDDRRIVVFGLCFFVISLLPFLGSDDIASRYSYLSSIGFVILLVFSIEKAYRFLIRTCDKQIGNTLFALIVIIFLMLHLFQTQRIQDNWNSAGEKARKFILSMNAVYLDEWTKEPMQFYFVNVPTHNGEAWVFPVGIVDAVWFVFRNNNIKIRQLSSLDEALDSVKNPLKDKVFLFDDKGSATLKVKPTISPTVSIDK